MVSAPVCQRCARTILNREWRVRYRLPWQVWVKGVLVARFREERDARGFAQARYGAKAEVRSRYADDGIELPDTVFPSHKARGSAA